MLLKWILAVASRSILPVKVKNPVLSSPKKISPPYIYSLTLSMTQENKLFRNKITDFNSV